MEQSRGAENSISEQLMEARRKPPLETFDATVEFLRLPDPPAPRSSAETVSTSRLLHKVPKAAKKAFDQASKHIKKKRYAEAAALLEQAVAIDPEFTEAHNDLGTQYAALGRVGDAEQEFQKAIDLDAAFAVAHANLAASQYMRGDLLGAEKEARSALSFAPLNQASRHLLELIQANRKR